VIGRKGLLTALLAALLAGALQAESPFVQATALAQDAAMEADLKAAFLLNFARYTEWPDSVFAVSPEEFRIGVLGQESALEPLLRALKGKKIGGRIPKVIRGASPKDLGTCAMVYIMESEKDQTQALLNEYKGKPILTVGETDGFGEIGGILGFYKEDNRIKFGINSDALARAGLKATQLIRVAPTKWRDK
jgi:hypothetical protein